MKNKIYKVLGVFAIILFVLVLSESMTGNYSRGQENEALLYDTVLVDAESIKKYVEEQGEEYDASLLAVRRWEETFQTLPMQYEYWLKEYDVKKLSEQKEQDVTVPIREQGVPEGLLTIDEEIKVKAYCEKPSSCPLLLLEQILNVSIEERTWKITWQKEYDIPVTVRIYPLYKVYTGTLYEKDVWKDDEEGTFLLRLPVGYELRVYKLEEEPA